MCDGDGGLPHSTSPHLYLFRLPHRSSQPPLHNWWQLQCAVTRYVSEFESVLHEGAGARNQEELTERLVSIFPYFRLFQRNSLTQDRAFSPFLLKINVFLILKVGNPIHAYNLIRRFSIDIGNIERDIQEDDWAGGEYKL